jgi:hypothetical protein
VCRKNGNFISEEIWRHRQIQLIELPPFWFGRRRRERKREGKRRTEERERRGRERRKKKWESCNNKKKISFKISKNPKFKKKKKPSFPKTNSQLMCVVSFENWTVADSNVRDPQSVTQTIHLPFHPVLWCEKRRARRGKREWEIPRKEKWNEKKQKTDLLTDCLG